MGFLYLSAGLALLFTAIQQGQRLDWWRSGVFNGVVLVGRVLDIVRARATITRSQPAGGAPLSLAMEHRPAGILLFWFRFTLTLTIILIPQSLAIHGFEADQIGPAIIWSAVPLLLVAFTAGLLLLRELDPRLLMAVGLHLHGFRGCLNAQYTSAWSAANYYRTELLMGVGQAFAFIGVVACIVLQGIFSGGLSKPQRILTFSAFFHTIRLFGGTVGAVYMGHFIAAPRETALEPVGAARDRREAGSQKEISALAASLYAKSSGAGAAGARAVDLIAARLRLQAYALSLIDGFLWSHGLVPCSLLLVALLRKSPLNYGDLSAMQPGKETNS